MKICMVSGHACIRCQKMAIPLIEKGHSVHMIAGKLPTYYEQYDSFVKAPTVRQYINAIRIYDKEVDLFHCHNEPSWFVTAIKENTDKPVVLDVHDSHLARLTPEEEDILIEDGLMPLRIAVEERNNFQLADGLVFCSEPFGDIVKSEFKLDQPSITLPSFLPDFMYQYQSSKQNWLGGLVYEGRVDLPQDTQSGSTGHGFRYCDYLELAKEVKNLGIDFHLYPGRELSIDEKFFNTYKDYAYMHNARSFTSLMKSIFRHDWGLVGNIEHTPEWEVALPNKLFEYVAACVPVVVINAKHSAEWVEKYGIGIVVNNMKELAERWGEHRNIRKNLIKMRSKFIMQNHISKLEDLYRVFI